MKCKLCKGGCRKLGQIGDMKYYRCRHCGTDWMVRVKKEG